jgi:hypothetical protein
MLNATTIKKLSPGQWAWVDGISFRRNLNDDGGVWYIKYRAPTQGHNAKELSAPTRLVKERLPNCRNHSMLSKKYFGHLGAQC